MKLSKLSQELLQTLNGSEVHSIKYEGCVGVSEGKVYRDGEVIDTLDSNKKVKELFDELCEDEGVNYEMEQLFKKAAK